MTLAEYLYKRITEDFTGAHMSHITKDVIDASDIDRYIREYNEEGQGAFTKKALHKKWMKEGLTELAKTIEPKI
jgi:hypothetical protein